MSTSRRDQDARRRITRRGLIAGGLAVTLTGGLAARLWELQVRRADEFRLLAEENRINIRLIPPERGRIADREGRLLADNEQVFRVVVIAEDAGDVEDVIARLGRLLALSPEEQAEALEEIRRRPYFVPVTVADRVPWSELAEVAVNAPALPGVQTEVGRSRVYPRGPDLAHVVGYVGPVSDYDLQRLDDPDPLLRIPRFQIGKIGVERALEHVLRGRAGTRRIEVNARGRVIRELDRVEGEPGRDVQLTIDARLQNFVQARLGEESAAVVVLDTRSGDVLASASSPSFDPNKFVRGIAGPDYRALLENERRPLSNKCVQGAYPPGSTFKIVTIAAALEAGLVAPEETVYCRGFVEVANRRFHCWKRAGHGHVDLLRSLAESCDVYYYELAQRVGIERIAAMARRLGLGRRFELPLSGSSEGLVPDKAWKLRRHGREWQIGDSLNAAIGQGFVLATPMQLAVMTARVASGRALEPRLVKSIAGVEQEAPPAGELDLSPRTLALIRQGLDEVVNGRRGTARRSRIVLRELRMAGKTGTSQVRNISAAERAAGVFRNEDLPWNRRDHALFVAFGPVERPSHAVAVVVEHGGSGSRAASPIARDVLLAAMTGGLPPLEAYPAAQRKRMEELLDALPLRPDIRPEGGRTRA